MTDSVTIGKRLIAVEDIALIEPFDPADYPDMRTRRSFASRVVLIDRQSVLSEETVDIFAKTHGFRVLGSEKVAANPTIRFGVETFVPAEGFEPTKPFKTRLSWRDHNGDTQSKLLLSAPENVLTVVRGAETAEKPQAGGSAKRRKPTASIDRRRARRQAPEPAPI